MNLNLAFDAARFDEALFEATEAAQVGFRFEEGGCWGMAEALFLEFQERGFQVQLMYQPEGFVHAWVRLGALHLDWTGVMRSPLRGTPLADLMALRQVAAQFGSFGEDYEADVATARAVLQAAFVAMEEGALA